MTELNNITQYDWANGESDETFEFVSDNQVQRQIYIRNKGGLTFLFAETELSLLVTKDFGFDEKTLPGIIEFRSQHFNLTQHFLGIGHHLKTTMGTSDVEQWIYTSGTGDQIRIVKTGAMYSYFMGSKKSLDTIQSVSLDLKSPEELKQKRWDDSDFV